MEDVQVLSWQVTPESKLSTQDWHKIPLNNFNLLRKDPAVNCACLSLSISLINDVNQVTWVSWSITCKPIGELQLSNMTNEFGRMWREYGGGRGGGVQPPLKKEKTPECRGVCVRVCARGDQQRGLLLLVGSIMWLNLHINILDASCLVLFLSLCIHTYHTCGRWRIGGIQTLIPTNRRCASRRLAKPLGQREKSSSGLSQSRLRTRSSTCRGRCSRWVVRVRVGELPM